MLQVSSTAIDFFACVLVCMFSRAEAKLCESLKKMMGISSILRRESCDLLLLTHRRQARHIAILSTQRRLTVRRMINSNSITGRGSAFHSALMEQEPDQFLPPINTTVDSPTRNPFLARFLAFSSKKKSRGGSFR